MDQRQWHQPSKSQQPGSPQQRTQQQSDWHQRFEYTEHYFSQYNELARIITHNVGHHPVPYGIPGCKGCIFNLRADTGLHLPEPYQRLASLIEPFITRPHAHYLLSINQLPPTNPDDFALRPHCDRLWDNGRFESVAANWSRIFFIGFPQQASGGELVVMNPEQDWSTHPIPRENGRQALHGHHQLIQPKPGGLCHLTGALPHAVLGFSSRQANAWRTTVVLAEFTNASDSDRV